MTRLFYRSFCAMALIGTNACSSFVSSGAVYTLYRNSPLDARARYHVATFDSADGDSYNNENCDVARGLFQGQEGVTARFWCEKGRYRR